MSAIDVHTHLAVPEADALVTDEPGLTREQTEERAGHSEHSLRVNQAQLGRLAPQLTDVRTRLSDMDKMSVDVQVVGPMPMHHYWAPPRLAEQLARVTNEAVAAQCAQAPDRLIGLGTVPLQHPALAVAELREAAQLGLRGISVSTTVDGRELADPSHEPVWACAEELGLVVFVHPWGCSLGSRLAEHYLGNTVGQPVETTIALSKLIFSGTLDRHPRLRLVAAHGGGYLPTYIGRSDHAWQVRPDARTCELPPSAYLRRIWFDSLVYTPEGLEHLVAVAGGDRVMLGTDYPFDMGVDDPLDRLAAATVDDATRAAIRGVTAAGLFALGDS